MSWSKIKYSLLIPLLSGSVLRLFYLGGRSFWNDEGLTVSFAGNTIFQAFKGCTTLTADGLLYYGLVWIWGRLFGVNEFTLGLFSAIAGIFTIYVIYKIGHEIAGERVAFYAALITALVPYMVYASYEIRPYASFLGLMASLALYMFILALKYNLFMFWFGTGIFTAACGYVHPVGWSVGLTIFLYVLLAKDFRKWKYIRNAYLTLGMAIIVNVPQIILAYQHLHSLEFFDSSSGGNHDPGIIRTIIIAVKQFIGGNYRIMTGYYFMDLGGAGLRLISGNEILLFFITLLTGLGLPVAAAIYLLTNKPKWGLLLFLMFLTAFVQVFWEGTDPRRFTPPAVAMYIIVAMAYVDWGKLMKYLTAVLLIVTFLFSNGKMYSMSSSIAKPEDYRMISSIIKSDRQSNDFIIFYGGPPSNHTWEYYDPGGTIYAAPEYEQGRYNAYFRPDLKDILSSAYFDENVGSHLTLSSSAWLVYSNYPLDVVKSEMKKKSEKYKVEFYFEDSYNILFKVTLKEN